MQPDQMLGHMPEISFVHGYLPCEGPPRTGLTHAPRLPFPRPALFFSGPQERGP
jgi:hypothetical protein